MNGDKDGWDYVLTQFQKLITDMGTVPRMIDGVEVEDGDRCETSYYPRDSEILTYLKDILLESKQQAYLAIGNEIVDKENTAGFTSDKVIESIEKLNRQAANKIEQRTSKRSAYYSNSNSMSTTTYYDGYDDNEAIDNNAYANMSTSAQPTNAHNNAHTKQSTSTSFPPHLTQEQINIAIANYCSEQAFINRLPDSSLNTSTGNLNTSDGNIEVVCKHCGGEHFVTKCTSRKCFDCNIMFNSADERRQHWQLQHKNTQPVTLTKPAAQQIHKKRSADTTNSTAVINKYELRPNKYRALASQLNSNSDHEDDNNSDNE